MDESAFYPLPVVVRTWAPRSQTPILLAVLTRDHLSVIGGITPAGQLLLQIRARSLHGPDVVRFLQHLLRHIPGKLLVVWDGAPIHRTQVVKDFLAQGGAARIWLEQLPAYAPELNPDGECSRPPGARGARDGRRRIARSMYQSSGQLVGGAMAHGGSILPPLLDCR